MITVVFMILPDRSYAYDHENHTNLGLFFAVFREYKQVLTQKSDFFRENLKSPEVKFRDFRAAKFFIKIKTTFL